MLTNNIVFQKEQVSYWSSDPFPSSMLSAWSKHQDEKHLLSTHGAKLRSLDTFQLANRHMCLGILSPDLWWATSYGERVVIPTLLPG